MKREVGEVTSERSKSNQPHAIGADKQQEHQIRLFLSYIKKSPRAFQRQLAPYLFELKRELPSNQRIKEVAESLFPDQQHRFQPIENAQTLIHTYFKTLQLKNLSHFLGKHIERVESERLKPIIKKKQDIFQKKQAYQKIDLIHPEYDIFVRLSKQERTHFLPPHIIKTKTKDFYAESRFITRVEQLNHFRSNQRHKGNILFLRYQGSLINGRNSYAVASDRSIEVWEAVTEDVPLPVFAPPPPPSSDGNPEYEPEAKKELPKKELESSHGRRFSFSHKYLGHTDKVTSISFSKDEYYLISGSVDRTVKLWCLRLKILLAEYRSHMKTVWDVHFSPSGYYFLSGSADGTMILWKSDVPNAQRVFYHKSDVYKVSFAKDPAFAISAGEDGNVKIWKILQGELHREIAFSKPVINFNLGFSGVYILTVQSDGKITIIDLIKGDIVNSFYFYEPDSRKKRKELQGEEKKEKASRKMLIHDICISQDEREISCVAAKYILVYSMDKLEQKVAKNIFSIFESNNEGDKLSQVTPKQVIYMGIETNLTFCSYQDKNVLVVGGVSGKI